MQAREDPQLTQLLQIGLLCSETAIDAGEDGRRPSLNGTATENALVQLALDVGLDARASRRHWPRLSIQHRSDAYRFMVTRHRSDGGSVLVAVKGSPDDVLRLCSRRLHGSETMELTDANRDEIARDNLMLAEGALRVLGFAFKELAGEDDAEAVPTADLTWVGLAGLADPVRPGASALMRVLRGAGIHPLVMTGDQVATARAVARQLGLGKRRGNRGAGLRQHRRVDAGATGQSGAARAGVRPSEPGRQARHRPRAAGKRRGGCDDGRRHQRQPGDEGG